MPDAIIQTPPLPIEIETNPEEIIEFVNTAPLTIEVVATPKEVVEFKNPPLIVVEIEPKPKEIIEFKIPPSTVIEMQYTAPGPKGDPGTPGQDGQDGAPGVDATYIHNQIAASTVWLVEHNLGKKPSVSIVDSAETLIIGDVIYLDNNRCQIELSMTVSGKAYCN